MHNENLGYTAHACRSLEADRLKGAGLTECLEKQTFAAGSAGLFLQASLGLPFSFVSYQALLTVSLKDYRKRYIRLVIGKGRRICWIYNLWQNTPEQAIRTFLRLPQNFEFLAESVFPGLAKGMKLKDLLVMIEATHIGRFSPLLISIMGGRFDAAQPQMICLEADTISIKPIGDRRARHISQSTVADYVRRLARARYQKDPALREDDLKSNPSRNASERSRSRRARSGGHHKRKPDLRKIRPALDR